MEIIIRQAAATDADAINLLSGQLGYPLSPDQLRHNLKTVMENNEHEVLVAEWESTVIGWIGVSHSVQLESPPFCEIRGLVVDETHRGKGIGRLLIEKAKLWGREKGNSKVRLRCNVKRTQTHLFYDHLGFKEIKEQKVFEIAI